MHVSLLGGISCVDDYIFAFELVTYEVIVDVIRDDA